MLWAHLLVSEDLSSKKDLIRLLGAPADLVNVRMQNDCKLAKENRRNYKHAIDGIVRICREEGPKKLFNGKQIPSIYFISIILF